MASFRCYDNSDVIANLIMTNFSTFLFMVTQFMLKLGIDPEKLYRATFICSYMTVRPQLCCCNMALVSFRLFRENLGNCCEIFLGKWFTPQPPFLAKKVPYMAYYWQFLISVKGILSNHKNKKNLRLVHKYSVFIHNCTLQTSLQGPWRQFILFFFRCIVQIIIILLLLISVWRNIFL